ncbi:MAG: SUMF1/EgtB/PvdO family nonheme iron enzyme [Planctomycetota bacterium]
MADLDPYHQWLAIPLKDQPPNHYRILGVELFESNTDVIAHAADKQMSHIRSFQTGKHSNLSQKLLNEIATAKICLLNPEKKDVYDQKLRQQAAPVAPAAHAPPVAPSPVAPSPVAALQTGELDFLEAPAIAPKATLRAKPKQSSDKNQIWIGLGAAVVLAMVVAFNLGRNGKDVASTNEPSPSTVAPTKPGSKPQPKVEPKPVPQRKPTPEPTPEPQAEPQSEPDAKPKEGGGVPEAGVVEKERVGFEKDRVKSVYLATLPCQEVRIGDSIHTAAAFNGKTSPNILWARTPGSNTFSHISYSLNGQFRALRGGVGIADSAKGQQIGTPLVFRIVGDGKPLWQSKQIGIAGVSESFNLSVVRVKILDLFVDCPGPERSDHGLWIEPEVESKPPSSPEEPTELIPPPLIVTESETNQPPKETSPVETRKEPPTVVAEPNAEPVKPKEKPPAPAKAEQEKALTTIREIYKDDYRAADQVAFAKKLIQKADESKDDLVARFVLLREAKSAAVRGNNSKLAFEVLDMLAEEYDVKVSQAKADTLEKIAIKARLPEARRVIAEAALEAMDQAIREEDFDAARQLGKQAGQSARLSKDAELIKSILAKNKEVEAVAKAFADIEDAMATLKEKPNDPDANLAVGKYLCHKGDWEKGLPMLVLSSDAKLKALAEQDIKGATTPEEQVTLGNDWWNIGQGAKGEWRGVLLTHAGTWYQQAQPNLTTVLVKSLVEKRLKEITDLGRDIPTVSGKSPPLAVAPFDEKMAKKHQSRWARYLGEPVVQTNSIKMKLVLIPPGKFQMGSPDSESGALKNEKPQHSVRITKPYWLGVTEVTQEQYQRVMGSNPSGFKGPKNPVEKVSWDEAVEFCRKLSALPGEKAAKRRYALPTEAQWEDACRAGNPGRRYFSPRPGLLAAGEEEKLLGEYAWSSENAGGKTHLVGEKKSNAFGLYDMYGNVWEWCADWLDEGYYAKSPLDDPMGATGGSLRVFRGGSWLNYAGLCRSAFRHGDSPGNRYDFLGFRVSLVPAE